MKTIKNLNLGRLSILELGQLVKSSVLQLQDLPANTIKDTLLNAMIAELDKASIAFDSTAVHLRGSEKTEQIAEADLLRSRAIKSLKRYLLVFEYSDKASEVEAFKQLQIAFNAYKELHRMSYEEETNAVENLIQDLRTDRFENQVAELKMKSYIDRLEAANEAFKDIYYSRMKDETSKEELDTKAIRQDLLNQYKTLVEYIEVLAKVNGLENAEIILQAINAVRKRYN